MAIGVPETEVFAAADATLVRGERATVERVRLELGRGSPAQVGGLLDQWCLRRLLGLAKIDPIISRPSRSGLFCTPV